MKKEKETDEGRKKKKEREKKKWDKGELSEKEQELLNINKDIVINIEEENKKFLKEHRDVFYEIEKAYDLEKELSISNKEIYKVELEV